MGSDAMDRFNLLAQYVCPQLVTNAFRLVRQSGLFSVGLPSKNFTPNFNAFFYSLKIYRRDYRWFYMGTVQMCLWILRKLSCCHDAQCMLGGGCWLFVEYQLDSSGAANGITSEDYVNYIAGSALRTQGAASIASTSMYLQWGSISTIVAISACRDG